MEQISKQRIGWIDGARGIAIFFVIYYHVQGSIDGETSAISSFLSPLRLPAVFFIAGYLFKDKFSFMQLLEHRIRMIFLPWLFFSFAIVLLTQVMTFNEHGSLSEQIIDNLLQIRGKNDQVWFVAAIFIMNIPFYFLVKYIKNSKALLLVSGVLFLLSTAYVQWLKLPALPWHIQFIGFGCFYMALGLLYRRNEQKIVSHEKRINIFLLFVIYLCIFLICKYLLKENFMSFMSSKFLIDAILITGLGILLVVRFAKIKDYKLFTFIGANSLLYFAMHGKVFSLLIAISDKLLVKFGITHTALIDFGLGIGITVLDALILIIPVLLVNKYAPFLVGKKYKLWKT
ncbi:MAG: acyltransferase family protein [Prevotellaceae bacterium]|jgi:fucose 4-O-acetylase-like acetyltransferase|nr:acyltransferase family protein [Prevotellaceae bacterium]